MTGTSSEWSEEAPGADILDLDRYMRGTKPARRPHRDISSSGLVVDGGAVGRSPTPPTSSESGSEPSDKRFSHDSGLSETSYRRGSRQDRRNEADSVTKNETETRRRRSKSGGEARRRGKSSGEARRGKSGGEAKRGKSSGDSRRGESGSELRRSRTSESSSFRESLERALREQQAQIARVAQMCELQARSTSGRRSEHGKERRSERGKERHGRPSGRGTERHGRPSERGTERHGRPSERRSDKRCERAAEPKDPESRTSSCSSEFSSSSSSVDQLKRRTSECRTYKIIMSKLDELNRLFVARRSLGAPGAPVAPAPRNLAPASKIPAARNREDSSVTVSDKVVGTDTLNSPRQKQTESERNRTTIQTTAAVDIPPSPRTNVVTESVVHEREISAPASEKGMPGRFHLDDPVRLYQQAKRLEARERRPGSYTASRHSSHSGSGSKGSSHSGSGSKGSSSQGSGKGSSTPSLCALCRCYWLVARRYVAQLNPVRE